jgi:NTE family protein
MHKLQQALRDVYKRLPAKELTAQDKKSLAELGRETRMHIVRLAYPGQDWHMASKDINFSRGSIEWRWQQGYEDASRALKQAAWLLASEDNSSVVVHEILPARPGCA